MRVVEPISPSGAGPERIDPLAPPVAGRYEDAVVTVSRREGVRPPAAPGTVRTPHFDVTSRNGRVLVSHVVPAAAVDDDLTGLLGEELFEPGWLRGADLFERVFTGVVRTSAPDALGAWQLFYVNTLARLEAAGGERSSGSHAAAPGSIAGYAPVHQHAMDLLRAGSVLELGCCFGFLALRIARTGRAVTASEASPRNVGLLAAVAPRLGVRLRTVTADAARFPAPDGIVETVLAVHLLEHLEPEHGRRVVAEALRLARRRVVIAVPLEDEADETYGHLRTVSLGDLRRWGRGTGLGFDVHEHHGGWLVLDKPPARGA